MNILKPFTVLPKDTTSPYRSGQLSKFLNQYKRHILIQVKAGEDIMGLEDFYWASVREEKFKRLRLFEKYLTQVKVMRSSNNS